MPLSLPEAVIEVLKGSSGLAGAQEWQPVTGLISIAESGVSAGVAKESFKDHDAKNDDCDALMIITVWCQEVDPVAGEARARGMAHAARLALLANRTLGGLVEDLFVADIEYVTADVGTNMLAHVAEIKISVNYLADRAVESIPPAVDKIQLDTTTDD